MSNLSLLISATFTAFIATDIRAGSDLTAWRMTCSLSDGSSSQTWLQKWSACTRQLSRTADHISRLEVQLGKPPRPHMERLFWAILD
eukprot:5893375-Amphidinium_carterae.1